MDNLVKQQNNRPKKKRNSRRHRKKTQSNSKESSGASVGGESSCSRKNSGSMQAGLTDATEEMSPHYQSKSQLKPTRSDPANNITVQQITGPTASKSAGSVQEASSAAATAALPPCRPLHSCPTPWRPGEKTAPVQLGGSANPNETHHRTILAILNRITDTKMELLLNRSVALILPLDSCNDNFLKHMARNKLEPEAFVGSALPLAKSMSGSIGCSNLTSKGMVAKRGNCPEATNRVEITGVGAAHRNTPGEKRNIQRIRKDFVSMLLEKAQEEEMYTREYSSFLRGLCAAIEVETDCAQLALERVLKRWGDGWCELVHLGGRVTASTPPSELEHHPGAETPVTGAIETEPRGQEWTSEAKHVSRKSKLGRVFSKDKRKGMLMAGVKSTDTHMDSAEQVLDYKQCHEPLRGVDEQRSCSTEHQRYQGIELSENVCDLKQGSSLNTRSGNGVNDRASCDSSSFSKITPTDAELESFLGNSLDDESQQISCCGAYGDLTRFRTVVRHRALYRELFIQGPSFRELVSTEALLRFNVLYGSLRQLYAGTTPWDEDEERHVRRRLKNHLRLMVMLHLCTLLPLETLELVRNTLASPLENPAAAAALFAGGLAPQPPHAQDGAVPFNQAGQLPLQGHVAGVEEHLQQDNVPLVAALPDAELALNNNAAVVVNLANFDVDNNHINNLNNIVNNNPNILDNNPNIDDNDFNNVNNLNDVNNVNEVIHVNTSGASLTGLSSELLSFYLTTAGHINLRDRDRTDEVCDLLQHSLPHLSSRQTFLVVTVLELQQRGWTMVKAPDRSG